MLRAVCLLELSQLTPEHMEEKEEEVKEEEDLPELSEDDYLKLDLLFEWIPSQYVCRLSRCLQNGHRPPFEVLAPHSAKVDMVMRQLAPVHGLEVTEMRRGPLFGRTPLTHTP